MTIHEAMEIKSFISTFAPTVSNIIVHCSAGISRSAAVGFVLERYLNKVDDESLFRKGIYSPNKWVYFLMCIAFNLYFSESSFDFKSNLSDKKCSESLDKFPELQKIMAPDLEFNDEDRKKVIEDYINKDVQPEFPSSYEINQNESLNLKEEIKIRVLVPKEHICDSKHLTKNIEYEILEIEDDAPITPDECYKIRNDLGEEIWIDDWDCEYTFEKFLTEQNRNENK